jgi:hypothetical protein
VGQIEEPAYALGNPAACHSAHCSDEGLENLFVRKLRKNGEVRCVAAWAAVRACCADNVEVAFGTSPVSLSIFRLNPGAFPAARSLLPLDVGLSFAVFLDLDHALHHTSRAGAMHSRREYTQPNALASGSFMGWISKRGLSGRTHARLPGQRPCGERTEQRSGIIGAGELREIDQKCGATLPNAARALFFTRAWRSRGPHTQPNRLRYFRPGACKFRILSNNT